jgi:cytochrome oxidase Cu insertion factor (SCO1/SenC/PrrC family)
LRSTITGMMTSVGAWALALGLAAVATAQQATPPAQPPPPPEPILKVGDPAPEFALQGSDGKVHRLSDYKGKTVVLAWFPAAFTAG